jgi:hypothetical protein
VKPVDFPESNLTLGPPKGWTEEQCSVIKAWRGKDSDGRPVVLTCWELTDEEIGALMLGEKLYLRVLGETTPPVGIQVGSPFTS